MAGKISKKTILGEGGLGAMLGEDRIQEIAKKEYVNDQLGGPKTEEGKKTALRNLRPKTSKIDIDNMKNLPNIDIEELPDKEKLPLFYLNTYKVLSQDEQIFYVNKWYQYLDEFEMNSSADESLLNVIIMEEIIYNRLYRAQLATPHEDLSKQMSESVKRHGEALKSLGISRSQRLGAKTGQEENIATLIQTFDKSKVIELEQEKTDQEAEEEVLLRKKRVQIQEELKGIEESKGLSKGEAEAQSPPITGDTLTDPKDINLSERLKGIFDEAALN